MRPAQLLVGITAALLLVPLAHAELRNPDTPTPTTLYFHIFDSFTPFPINTQAPNTTFFEVGGTNFPTVAANEWDFNTIYGFATAGPVEYEFVENGKPRFHPERGIAADVRIDSSVQPKAYIYLDVRDALGSDQAPSALPSFTVAFSMREGNEVADTALLDGMPLIMEGQLTAHVVDGHTVPLTGLPATGPDGAPVLTPDESGIVEFAIPLELAAQKIPKAGAYHVRIDWWQNPTGDAQNDDQFAMGALRLASDGTHSPRLELSILNPVYIEYIHPQVAAGVLLIHAGVNSPWGTYDVAAHEVQVTIDGPTKPSQLVRVITDGKHSHNEHDKAAQATYIWRFRADEAASGDYKINVRVENVAGTGTATGDAGFVVEDVGAYGTDEGGDVVTVTNTGAPEQESPAPLLAALAALGIALLRRRSA